jgi:hypothetical protein
VFGLIRQYYSNELPTHDPEEHVSLQDLSDDPPAAADVVPLRFGDVSGIPSHPENPFYPFLNKSSFLLGDWYWNQGLQKTRKGFRSLLNIIGDPQFRAEDIQNTKWSKIDAKLKNIDIDNGDEIADERGAVDGNEIEEDWEWMDEDVGWRKTQVSISVPFSKRHTKTPGPQRFVVGDFYHRPFVSVIREKLSKAEDDQQFHYDPFELFWRAPGATNDMRVHGELYTSPAFLDVHRELQESAGEPGCNLPRVVVAMMFWSDATHLTSFGSAKLWPNYLYFGNESKYRRCKPTCHLCNHVAYFQVVRYLPCLLTGGSSSLLITCYSFRMHFKILLQSICVANAPVPNLLRTVDVNYYTHNGR